MIPLDYHQFARQVHQERINAALNHAERLPRTGLRSHRRSLTIVGWLRLRLLDHWTLLPMRRAAARRG